jgi:hypothetical protein
MGTPFFPFLLACGPSGPATESTSVNTGVEATPYEQLPVRASFPWTKESYEGKSIQYYIPEEPKAVLWVFHGTAGGFGSVTQIEWLEIYNLLVPFGVAIVLNESLDREAEQWQIDTTDPAENLDFVRLAEVRDYLNATTALSEATPVLAIGFSNGAWFATRFVNMAQQSGWDVRAFIVHNSANYAGDGIPGLWVSAENDDKNGGPESVETAAAECTLAAGEECPFVHGVEIPLDPRRFARLPEYSLAQSQNIFDELVEFEYVDADGERLIEDLTDLDGLMTEYSARSEMPFPTLPPTQLRVVWATHRVSSQHVVEETDWLLSRF